MKEVSKSLLIELCFKNPVFWIMIILGIIVLLFYKHILGRIGEYWVKQELKKLPSEYKVLNNLLIKTRDGKTHQIDHIVVSKYGIIVIETKHWNSFIIGTDYDKSWIIKSGNKTIKVCNPVHQNYGHIKSLEEVLNIKGSRFTGLVCISSNAKLKIKSEFVVKINNLNKKIIEKRNVVLLNTEEIYSKLFENNINSKMNRKLHVRALKK